MEIVGSARTSMKFLQRLQPGSVGMLAPSLQNMLPQDQMVRHRQTKHWKPEFKKLRKQKFIKVDLPNFQEKSTDLSPEEIRSRMKERGVLPPRPWMERAFHVSCTGGIFEAYVPPEGDGKKSFISTAGAKQKFEFLEKKSKSMLALRKLRNYEEDFSVDEFGKQAQDIYIAAHEAMAARDKRKLREYVTERCYPEMMHNIKYKTIHWRFLQSLEPARMVHARVTDIITKENLFAQVTVRFNTQQMLAIYDRFGRLMHGSEMLSKDVLEYVVFEKHISNMYGQWRMHHKIIPDWLPPKQAAPITYRLIEESVSETALLPPASESGDAVPKLAEGDKKLEADVSQQQQQQQQQQLTAADASTSSTAASAKAASSPSSTSI